VIAFGLLLLLEGALRIGSTIREDLIRSEPWRPDFFQAHRPSPTLGWERRPGYTGLIARTRRDITEGNYFIQDAAQVGDTTQRRVWFLGDSRTFGHSVNAEEAFPEVVERLLPGVAAINLAVPGYSAYQGHVLLQQYLARAPRPDAIVVAFGYNDRRYSRHPDSADHFRALYEAIQASRHHEEAPDRLYLLRGLRSLARRAGLVPSPPPRVASVRGLRPRVDEGQYAQHLEGIVATARAAGVPVLFLSLDDSPIQTYHLRHGVQALRRHDYPLAIAHLSAGAESRQSYEALSRVYLAQAYQKYGDATSATRATRYHERFPSSIGGAPIRLSEDYHLIVRSVAGRHDVPVVDGGAAVLPTHYLDDCHLTVAGHARVAAALVPTLRAILRR
jgi:lysophospholipase L1-like esterase